MKATVGSIAIIAGLLAAACDQRSPVASSPIAPTAAATQSAAATGGRLGVYGGTSLKEALSGAAINGVVPEGQALADESQFVKGGSTILTVQVKNVNLPDGASLAVTLDFSPVGTIALSHGEGTLTADLGRFAVSRDQVRVNNGTTTVLVGGFFN